MRFELAFRERTPRTLPRDRLTHFWTLRVRLVFVHTREVFSHAEGREKGSNAGFEPGPSVRYPRHEPSELYGLVQAADFKNIKIILCTGKNSIIISVKLRHSSRNIENTRLSLRKFIDDKNTKSEFYQVIYSR